MPRKSNGSNGKVELIPLNCQKCGSGLGNFQSGLSKCSSCGTLHFLNGFKGLKESALFLESSVVVEIPPAIAVGELLRANDVVVGNRFRSDDYAEESNDPKNPEDPEKHRDEIEAIDYLAIAVDVFVDEEEEVEIAPGNIFGFGRKTEKKTVSVRGAIFPMCMKFGKLPFVLNVYGRQHMARAQEIANQINKSLGYTIKVSLRRT